MRRTHLVAVAVLIVLAAAIWQSKLWTVARPGDRPRPLSVRERDARPLVSLDVVVPSVPVGSQHVVSGTGVTIVHYWAPWERNSRLQAVELDSLRRLPEMTGLRVLVVSSDPFPSVTRFVARERLRLNVLIDGRGDLRRALPCPSIPYTYVLDGGGRIAIAQAGEVEWLARATRDGLVALLRESDAERSPPPRPAPRAGPS